MSVRPNLLDAGPLQARNGADVARRPDGAFDVHTPDAPWAYALLVPLTASAPDEYTTGVRVIVDVEGRSGAVGLFVTDAAAQVRISGETTITPDQGRCRVRLDAQSASARFLCVRSSAEGGGHVRIHAVDATTRRRFDVSHVIDDLVPIFMREPGPAALDAAAAALSAGIGHRIVADDIGALVCARAPVAVSLDAILNDEDGRLIREDAARLADLLSTYDPGRMDRRSGYLGPDYFRAFFRQSTIRVYHLVRILRELGLTRGTILEIGSLFGQFALTLRRLGYDVTVVDRYRAYTGAFDGYIRLLREAGVTVVETDRTDEDSIIAGLGRFDGVISMAVIEHIPHTPRRFLEMLAGHVKPGGVLALDTPNVARYWNRERLRSGQSIHQAIADQFYGDVPWEGHHREYTGAEMRWMMGQIGVRDLRERFFDYNALQFPELSSEHLDALLAIAVDPTLADTVLVGGRVS